MPKAQGATSTTAWLRGHHRISPSAASRQVQLAKKLPNLPTLAAAMAAGAVNPEQAQVIAAALRELPADLNPTLKTDAEALMVEAASKLDPLQLKVVGTHLLSRIDPDRAEQHEREALERAEKRAARDRFFTLTPLGDGRTRLTGILGEEAAAIVNAAMQPLCRPADPDDHRTAGQRRADALRDVCAVALGTDRLPDNRGEKTTMTVTVPFEHHHRLIHHSEWQVYIAADGMPEFIPPVHVDPTRTPRRNHYWNRP
jgi:hypothetical protein